MSVYCVTYDLGVEGDQDYEGLIARMSQLGKSCEVTASTRLLSSSLDSGSIVDELGDYIGQHDRLAVFAVANRADWSLTCGPEADAEDTAVWMQENVCPH